MPAITFHPMKNCFGPHWCAFIVWTYIFKYPKYTFKYINIWNSYMRIIFSNYSDAISHSLIPYTMLHFLKVHCQFFFGHVQQISIIPLWVRVHSLWESCGRYSQSLFLKSIHCFLTPFFVFFLFHKHCIYHSTAGAVHYCVMVLGPLRPSSMALQLVLILAGETQDHRSSPPLLQMCLDQGKLTKRFVSFKTLMWLCHIFSADSHRYWSLCGVPFSMVSIRPVSREIFLFAKSGS